MQQRRRPLEYCATTFHSFSHSAEWDAQPLTAIFARDDDSVPISIFSGTMPALQAIVRYLRDIQKYSFIEMAQLLGRAASTLRVTYRNAREELIVDESTLRLPIETFSLGLSPLETVVYFLQQQNLRNVEIASLLHLDPRTTATIKRRIKEKGVVLDG